MSYQPYANKQDYKEFVGGSTIPEDELEFEYTKTRTSDVYKNLVDDYETLCYFKCCHDFGWQDCY